MSEPMSNAEVVEFTASLTRNELLMFAGYLLATAPDEFAGAVEMIRSERSRASAPVLVTTAGILRAAARVMRVQAPTVLGVAATIRLAAGGDAAGRALAEGALALAADHVEPGVRVADLEQWRRRRTCLQVAEGLELAASAAEQGGDQ